MIEYPLGIYGLWGWIAGMCVTRILETHPLEKRPCGNGALTVLIRRRFPLSLRYWQRAHPSSRTSYGMQSASGAGAVCRVVMGSKPPLLVCDAERFEVGWRGKRWFLLLFLVPCKRLSY